MLDIPEGWCEALIELNNSLAEDIMTSIEITEAKKYFHRKLAKLEKDLTKADDHGDSGLVMTLRKKMGYYRSAMTALNNAELEIWNRGK